MSRIRRIPRHRVDLVIAQNTQRASGLHHVMYQIDGVHLLRTPVDQIAHEDGRSFGVTPTATSALISQTLDQRDEPVVMPVDVADDVKVLSHSYPWTKRGGCRTTSLMISPLNRGPPGGLPTASKLVRVHPDRVANAITITAVALTVIHYTVISHCARHFRPEKINE